ncbi:hypothetical protein BIV23_35525 [Streptomyces monashensis]|uniref:Uncharacterized protein n=1 Tax=Streptomyces monashensis TaxID=1678012 RepID=A0A1S2PN60_9ACTN|nr:hypothetical protein BIV23_35525 [Streptomyces monashensis]
MECGGEFAGSFFALNAVHHEVDRPRVGIQVDLAVLDQASDRGPDRLVEVVVTAWWEPAVSVSAFTIHRRRLSNSMATNTTLCAMALR